LPSSGSVADRGRRPGSACRRSTTLASDRINNMSGANYVIDGGLIKTT
jgi:hypothetical protein